MTTLRRQKPIKGGRIQLPSCVIKDIHMQVSRLATKWKVSRSFVIAVALADQFGIDDQERYYIKPDSMLKKGE
jgi:hypothetical protein